MTEEITQSEWKWNGNWLEDSQSNTILWYTTDDDGVHCKPGHKTLIAAAPKLLEALKDLWMLHCDATGKKFRKNRMKDEDIEDYYRRIEKQTQAAIAAAKGGAA